MVPSSINFLRICRICGISFSIWKVYTHHRSPFYRSHATFKKYFRRSRFSKKLFPEEFLKSGPLISETEGEILSGDYWVVKQRDRRSTVDIFNSKRKLFSVLLVRPLGGNFRLSTPYLKSRPKKEQFQVNGKRLMLSLVGFLNRKQHILLPLLCRQS